MQWITEVKEDQQSRKYRKLLEKEYENQTFYSVRQHVSMVKRGSRVQGKHIEAVPIVLGCPEVCLFESWFQGWTEARDVSSSLYEAETKRKTEVTIKE